MTAVRYKITQTYYIIMAKVINPLTIFWKKVLSYSKIKHTFISSEISFLGLYSREMKIYFHTETCMKVFAAALFLTAKGGNNLNAISIN